jgi:hypothetical protein
MSDMGRPEQVAEAGCAASNRSMTRSWGEAFSHAQGGLKLRGWSQRHRIARE